MIFKGQYKTHVIEYNDEAWRESESFSTMVGESNVYAPTFKSLKAKLDGIVRKNFTRTAVILPSNWKRKGKYTDAEVTSHTEGGDVWVVDSNGNRSRVNPSSIYLKTEDTERKLDAINLLTAKINSLKDEADSIVRSIERYSVEE